MNLVESVFILSTDPFATSIKLQSKLRSLKVEVVIAATVNKKLVLKVLPTLVADKHNEKLPFVYFLKLDFLTGTAFA